MRQSSFLVGRWRIGYKANRRDGGRAETARALLLLLPRFAISRGQIFEFSKLVRRETRDTQRCWTGDDPINNTQTFKPSIPHLLESSGWAAQGPDRPVPSAFYLVSCLQGLRRIIEITIPPDVAEDICGGGGYSRSCRPNLPVSCCAACWSKVGAVQIMLGRVFRRIAPS